MNERFEAFTVLIVKLNRCIRKIKSEEMAELQLRGPHVSCLYYLYKMGPLTAKDLGDICEEDKAALSRSVVYLEHNGYLVSKTGAQKKYKCPLELTEKGKEMGRQLAEKIDRIIGEASDGLSEADREVLYRGLNLICDHLQSICERYHSEASTAAQSKE